MNKEYVAPLIKVLDARLGEAVNLGVGSGGAGEQDQLKFPTPILWALSA